MASKSKKAVALLLTAMMAVAAMAGCGDSSAPATTVTSNASTQASTEELSNIDLDDNEVLATIKAQMKKEADEQKGDKKGKISLKVWCASTDLAFEQSLAKEFEEKFADSGYEIKIRVSGAIGEDSAGSKIIEGPEDGADVFNFADDQLSSLVEAGDIAPVAKYFLGNVKSENTDDSIAICTVNDEVYAYPKTSDNGYFLYYDKKFFDEADVADFDTMIEKAGKSGKAVFFDMGNGWYNTGFFFTAGCTVSYKDGKQTATYNSDEGLSAAKAMCHIAENTGNGFEGTPGTMGDNAYVKQGFEDGSLVAAVIGTWVGPDIKAAIGEENVGAAKLPTVLMDGEQKQLDSFGGYKLIGVNKFSTYSFSSQVLAYYLGCPDSQLKRYQTRGLIATSTEALENDKLKADPALLAIEAQKPYAHAQGQSVSGKYWASNIGGFGGEIVTQKGKLTDDQLKTKLKQIEDQMS